MLMPVRKYVAGNGYRYGFNGKENDNDVKGEGDQQDYGMRIYDPRLGRFLSVDPLSATYPWYTPYQFAGNKPIMAVDLDGLEEKPTTTGTEEAQRTQTQEHHYNGAGDDMGGKTTTWYYHKGGAQIGQTQDKKGNIVPVLSKSGWYTEDDYLKLLSKTYAAEQLAHSYSNFAFSRNPLAAKNELQKFVGEGLSQNAYNFLITAAYNLANKANFNASGYVEPSPFNVEDILGLGMILKEGLKVLGNYTAKNIASKGIDYIRKAFTVGGGRNIATLGGELEGNAGYFAIGISGQGVREGTTGVPVLRRFTTKEVGGYDRLYDSEVKVLEDFADKFHNNPNIKGTLTLTSERQFCASCSGVIDQFKKTFPNIKLNTVNGVK